MSLGMCYHFAGLSLERSALLSSLVPTFPENMGFGGGFEVSDDFARNEIQTPQIPSKPPRNNSISSRNRDQIEMKSK